MSVASPTSPATSPGTSLTSPAHKNKQPQEHTRHLLSLPTELVLLIIQFASSSPPHSSATRCPTGLQTLISLSLVCKALHYTVFCPESDETIWRHVAMTRLGTHPSLSLDKVIYPGLSVKKQWKKGNGQRSWRAVVRLGVAWERPFTVQRQPDGTNGPDGEWKVKKALRSFRPLPAPRGSERDNGWTVEMVCPGDGDSRTQKFECKMPIGDMDEGRITFQVRRREGETPMQGAAVSDSAQIRTVTAVVDLLGKGGARVGSRIRKGKGKSKVVHEDVKQGWGWTMTPNPGFTGYVASASESEQKDAGGNAVKRWIIKQVNSLNGTLVEDKVWDLGDRKPDRFVGEGDTIVAICFDHPDQQTKSENPTIPSNLVCVERVVDKNAGWLGKAETWRSRIRWEIDISREWAEQSQYTAFAHLKNFHVTKHHLVALVTRHPTAIFQKLTGTFFYVLDLQTGKMVNKIKLRKRIPLPTTGSVGASGSIPTHWPTPPNQTAANAGPNNVFIPAAVPPATTPAAFTTAFSHDFLLTDHHLVCGGPGGGLHIYNYNLRPVTSHPSSIPPASPGGTVDDGNKPLYSLPDPWTPDSPLYKHNPDIALSVPTESMQGMFVGRQYSGLTLSNCGRYLGATTSDQFWVWDMVKKRVRGVWSNGRKVGKGGWYSRSPGDKWVGGVWVLLNYQEDGDGGTFGRRRGGGIKRERLIARGGMGKGKHEEKVDLVGFDGVEEEEEEKEEIMVGYLTDLGVPEPGGTLEGGGRRGIQLTLGLGIRDCWERWKVRCRGMWMRIDMMSTTALVLMGLVLAVFAVVLGKGWVGRGEHHFVEF